MQHQNRRVIRGDVSSWTGSGWDNEEQQNAAYRSTSGRFLSPLSAPVLNRALTQSGSASSLSGSNNGSINSEPVHQRAAASQEVQPLLLDAQQHRGRWFWKHVAQFQEAPRPEPNEQTEPSSNTTPAKKYF